MKILINEGTENIKFGACVDEFVKHMGEPDYIEKIDDFNEEDSMAYIYDKSQCIAFFEGLNVKELIILETKSPEILLFGEKIYGKDDIYIIKLMKDHQFEILDTEMTEWGDKRISFDEANIDFYFEDGKLTTVNWGRQPV